MASTYEWVIVTLGVLTLGFAIAALIAETVWALLVPAIAGLVLTWARFTTQGRLVPGGWGVAFAARLAREDFGPSAARILASGVINAP